MVLHAAVEKPSTTLKALLLLLPVPLCSEMPFLTEGRVIEGSANKSNKHMLQGLLSLLVQARCCLKRTPVRGYATDSDIFLHVCTGVYPGFDLYATGVPPAANHNASDSSHLGHEPYLGIILASSTAWVSPTALASRLSTAPL